MWSNLIIPLLAVLIAAGVQPTPIPVPQILEGETRALRVQISHKDKLSESQKLTLGSAAKQVETLAHWEGEGAGRRLIYTRKELLNNGCIAEHVFTFLPGYKLRMKNAKKTITSPSGKAIQTEFYDFTDPVMKYPSVLAHPFTLELAFRTFDFTPGSRRAFNIWLNPAAILRMETVTKGIEEIELPGGKKMKCYRIDMSPNLTADFGALANRLLKPLIPDYIFWVSVDGMHPVVKYSGPMGQISPVGAPNEVHELLSYNPGKGG